MQPQSLCTTRSDGDVLERVVFLVLLGDDFELVGEVLLHKQARPAVTHCTPRARSSRSLAYCSFVQIAVVEYDRRVLAVQLQLPEHFREFCEMCIFQTGSRNVAKLLFLNYSYLSLDVQSHGYTLALAQHREEVVRHLAGAGASQAAICGSSYSGSARTSAASAGRNRRRSLRSGGAWPARTSPARQRRAGGRRAGGSRARRRGTCRSAGSPRPARNYFYDSANPERQMLDLWRLSRSVIRVTTSALRHDDHLRKQDMLRNEHEMRKMKCIAESVPGKLAAPR